MSFLAKIEEGVEAGLRRFGVAVLQLTLGLVYVWFGWLKLVDASPIIPVIRVAFREMPYPFFPYLLGSWEIVIGAGLLLPFLPLPRRIETAIVRIALLLLFLQLCGTFAAAILAPAAFFSPTLPYLTVVGEFLMKNLVFAAAGLVIAGHLRTPDDTFRRFED
ncbi:MAG: hypothetical protein A2991_03915 [Candidatus Terrybacteria bacterium RIFCSPLOWO2_01_FULL_58_14]|uniref:DUF417 family protein n=2 Tax=Candidatus Terryibacteriota TaxID=1817920 RepID=A0A1G2PYY1_9BACT|nr:MAG: hypothetical protein A2682_03340 [Candidatus Terrybacteria bacterium RIFCSPHIGHO2_01_FULL_58_15]OHA53515.1 MAG: hypothetical protein A2991_03915 [Candidatus Terrybacteria bacterium RIFCSPLOWO2_01_FULL_58_14]